MIYVIIVLALGAVGFVTFSMRSIKKKNAQIAELKGRADKFYKAYLSEKVAHAKTIENIKLNEEYNEKKKNTEETVEQAVADNTATVDSMLHILRNKAK
jgi:hypothetical protein